VLAISGRENAEGQGQSAESQSVKRGTVEGDLQRRPEGTWCEQRKNANEKRMGGNGDATVAGRAAIKTCSVWQQ